jgi:DUF1016 N-terminal domain
VPTHEPTALLADLRGLIQQAREAVARVVDSGLTTLYWHVGQRIRKDILKERRADYGESIVSALGTHLTTEFGRGFSERSLFDMLRFAEVFPDRANCAAIGCTIELDPGDCDAELLVWLRQAYAIC